jgi:transposase
MKKRPGLVHRLPAVIANIVENKKHDNGPHSVGQICVQTLKAYTGGPPMKHIGMDLHSTTTDACVRNENGEILLRRRIVTTQAELKKFLDGIPEAKRVAIEECQMADWVTRCLEPHVDEIIRSQPQFNRLISESEDKEDRKDAESLSELLYLNRIKPVHHPNLDYRNLREAVRAYWVASWELTRAKNRLKDFFLFHGVHEKGDRIYSTGQRERSIRKLKSSPGINLRLLELLYLRMDQCRQLKAQHIRLVRQSAKPMSHLVRLLQTMPAMGPIYAYTLVAYLEDGHRIRNKRKLWRYGGLSLRRHESRDIGKKKASRFGNRLIKHVALSVAATVASHPDDNALGARWEKDIRGKVKPNLALRNLARKILAIAQCLLRSKKEYSNELLIN